MAIINFDPRAVAPEAGNAGPVPDGWYTLIGKKFDVEPTTSGTGIKLASRFEIVAPAEFKGSVVFHNFNLKNDSEKAQQIGQGQLSALCHAVGLGNQLVSDTGMLDGRPFNARLVRVEEAGYQPKNEIKAFRSMQEPCNLGPSGGAAKAPAGAAAPAPAPAAWAPQAAPPVPPAAPMAQAPAPQYAPPAAPAAAPAYAPPAQPAPVAPAAAPQWQAPAAPQPWAQPDPNAPQAAPQQQYAPPAPAAAPAAAMPEWAHQQPVAAPAQSSGAPAPTSTLAPTPEAQAALSAPVPWAAPPQQ